MFSSVMLWRVHTRELSIVRTTHTNVQKRVITDPKFSPQVKCLKLTVTSDQLNYKPAINFLKAHTFINTADWIVKLATPIKI